MFGTSVFIAALEAALKGRPGWTVFRLDPQMSDALGQQVGTGVCSADVLVSDQLTAMPEGVPGCLQMAVHRDSNTYAEPKLWQ